MNDWWSLSLHCLCDVVSLCTACIYASSITHTRFCRRKIGPVRSKKKTRNESMVIKRRHKQYKKTETDSKIYCPLCKTNRQHRLNFWLISVSEVKLSDIILPASFRPKVVRACRQVLSGLRLVHVQRPLCPIEACGNAIYLSNNITMRVRISSNCV